MCTREHGVGGRRKMSDVSFHSVVSFSPKKHTKKRRKQEEVQYVPSFL